MSAIQRVMLKILPEKWAKAMEAESRSWMQVCPNCNLERSIWDIGGIRWGGSGRTLRLTRCPNCGKVGLHRFYRKQS